MKTWVKGIAGLVILLGGTRLVAGTWNLPMVWLSLGLYLGLLVVAWFVIFRKDPELVQERQQPGPDAKRWDRVLLQIYGWTLLITVVVALLDVGRLHWTDTVPRWLQIASLVSLGASLVLSGWAMAENRFFSEVVRVQRDRGHHVVASGPYRYVRHPSYLGNVISFPCLALAFGSWLGLILSLVPVALFVVRTALEDRTLRAELDGYAEYAQQVRYRLVPGIW